MEDKKCCVCNGPNKHWNKNDRCENCYIIYLKNCLEFETDLKLSMENYYDEKKETYRDLGYSLVKLEILINDCKERIAHLDRLLTIEKAKLNIKMVINENTELKNKITKLKRETTEPSRKRMRENENEK